MDLSANMIPIAFSAFALLVLVASGAFVAAVPYLMPKRECFAVTVPEAAQADPALRGFKRRYALIILLITAVMAAACAVPLLSGALAAAVGVMGIGVAILCIGSYVLMLFFRSKVRALKEKRGWKAEGAKTTAVVGNEPVPRALSMKWDLLFLVPVVLSLAICVAGYDSIPEEVPMQMDFSGQVSTYATKSYALVCFPAMVTAFIGAILAFSHWQMLRSKKFSDPAAPLASAWAYGMFLRAQSTLIVASGVVLGFVGVVMALAMVGTLTLGQAALWCLALVAAVVVGSLAVSAVYGQNGSRLIARVSAGDGAMQRDNDRFWKLGVFYVNREDPSLFVPERFGIGWTMNWGRPAVWVIAAGLVLAIVVFALAVLWIAA